MSVLTRVIGFGLLFLCISLSWAEGVDEIRQIAEQGSSKAQVKSASLYFLTRDGVRR